MNQPSVTIYKAAAVRDALGVSARPGFVAVAGQKVIAAGRVDDLSPRRFRRASIIHLPTTLIMPAMVNAHAHLDLTGMGPRSYDGDFTRWLSAVLQERPQTQATVMQSIIVGVELSRRAGVGWLGDIAGSDWAVLARNQLCRSAATALPGVSYLEVFGTASREPAAVERLESHLQQLPFETPAEGYPRGVVLGIQPHAPYSAGLKLYGEASRLSQERAYRLCTHLAESQEEIELVRDGAGPFVEMLSRLGRWDGSFKGTGKHPIDYLAKALRQGRWLLAHCNYVEDHHLRLLARAKASVVYCPVASDYFGHHQPARGFRHRYRDMLAARINVCLGTDSILCQKTSERQPLGILPQMRHLYRRDDCDPQLLLKMATTNGLLALDLDEKLATLKPGAPARLIGVQIDPDSGIDPLVQALASDAPAEQIPGTLGSSE